MTSKDSGTGAVLALFAGDALGATTEFQPLKAKPWDVPALSPMRGPMQGGGVFRLKPGQHTDDGQQAGGLCMVLRFCADMGKEIPYDKDVALNTYRRWMNSGGIGCGQQTAASLTNGAKAAWEDGMRMMAGNGSLMRCAPTAVALYDRDEDTIIKVAMADAAVTHYGPLNRMACAAYVATIAAIIRDAGLPGGVRAVDCYHTVAYQALEKAAAMLKASSAFNHGDLPAFVDAAQSDLQSDLWAARNDDPYLYGPELAMTSDLMGFVRVAFRLAFWVLDHAGKWDFRTHLLNVVNRGGDADTNGAIAGALLGAYKGVDAIPMDWREAITVAPRQHPIFNIDRAFEFLTWRFP